MNGFTGKILLVNLTERTWTEEAVPEEVYEHYLSGVGLGARILYERIPRGADPLGPDNMLGFVSGLLTGTGALFSGRWLVVGKSPLTGGWGDANCGGNFGPAIKRCGFDGIFITGAAAEPVYLFVDERVVEIRSAAHLWGMDAAETEDTLLGESGKPRWARAACIGKAGEKRSLIAGICNDHGRLAARSGLGAVMGSKKLKAILLAGSLPIQSADPVEMKHLSKRCNALVPKGDFKVPPWMVAIAGKFMGSSPRAIRLDGLSSFPIFRKWGTSSGMQVGILTGDTPVRNWSGTSADYPWQKLDSVTLNRRSLHRYHCYACPLGCGAVGTGLDGTGEIHRPEYENISGLGPMLLNTDLDSIFTINELYNRAGMDAISAGNTLAFAIQCFSEGLIDEKDTGGLRLNWGNSEAILRLAQQMVDREGFGEVLADGVRVAARRIGKGAERFAIHAGGQELSMHDPKYDSGYGIHYITEPTPGRHSIGSNMTYETLRLWTKVTWVPEIPSSYPRSRKNDVDEKKGLHAAGAALAKMVIDGAGLCNFGLMMGVDRLPMFEYLNAATGWQKTPGEYIEIGRRVETLRQLFNLREGVEPAEVKLPGLAYGDPPARHGPHKGKQIDIYGMRRMTWRALGWDETDGHPLQETLERLGLVQEGLAAG